jgi:hypothetical protein
MRLERNVLPFFGKLDANRISTDQIDAYVEKRTDEGAEAATVNREFAALRRILTLGYKSSPRRVREVPAFPRLKENTPARALWKIPTLTS